MWDARLDLFRQFQKKTFGSTPIKRWYVRLIRPKNYFRLLCSPKLCLMNCIFYLVKHNPTYGEKPGQVVREEDSRPRGRGFESRRMLDGCKRCWLLHIHVWSDLTESPPTYTADL